MNWPKCFFKHKGPVKISTKWIEVTAKKNPPNPVLLEIKHTCQTCGREAKRSYATRDQVDQHFKKLRLEKRK